MRKTITKTSFSDCLFAIYILALVFYFSEKSVAQTTSYPPSVFYKERPSAFRTGNIYQIPAQTLETIRRQNEELKKRGRKVNVHSISRNAAASNASACGTCHDMGVENGWDVWQAEEGENYDSLGLNLTALATPTPPRFNITTGAGIDPLTPGVNPGDPPITLVAPPGFGNSSIQMGQPQTDGFGGGCSTGGGGSLPAGCAERLTYCFTVGISDTNFVYAYAFVMENPNDTSHTLLSMPYVEFMILDAAGDTIPCAYQRYIASETFPGQYTCNRPRGSSGGGGGGGLRDTALYKPWTVQGVNLSAFIGQTLTVVITNADCQLGGHFCHSYWDFNCGSSTAIIKPSCYTNAPDTLVAPASPDTVNQYTYEWFHNRDTIPFANTQIVTPYSVTGDTFTVKVVLPSGCNWYARYVPQHFSVTADYLISTSCGSASFTEQAVSPSAEDPISFWSWNFSGGTPSTSTNPDPGPIIFTPGNHTVTLISGTYSPGCRDTIQYTVNVPQLPVASFSASNVCAGRQVAFNNTSSVPSSDTISSYSWSFIGGSPGTSTLRNPTVTYATSGTFQVTLIVTTTRGCKDTLQRIITVYPLPNASFTAPDVCFGNAINITNTSSVSSGSLYYFWSMPGGSPSNSSAQSPTVSYALADTFSISLIVQTANGCADTLVRNVIVRPKPQAIFSAPHACVGSVVQFFNSSISISGDTVSSVYWTFPGGVPAVSSTWNPSVYFSQPDTVDVQLIVTNQSGCRDTVVKSTVITPNPVAGFNASSFCFGPSLNLQNTSTVRPVGSSITYNWSVTSGNLSSGSAVNPVVTFASPGSSTITLIATANGGCVDTMEQTIQIYPIPVADFALPHLCAGVPALVSNLSSIASGDSISSYSWMFPSGLPSSSSSQVPQITFNVNDTISATLMVTSTHGCRDTIAHPVIITPNPTAAFSTSGICLGDSVRILNQSTVIPAGESISYSWSATNASPAWSSNPQPVFGYGTSGTSVIRLIATSPGGCTDTIQKSVDIHPLPVAGIAPAQVCFGSPLTLNNTTSLAPGDSVVSYQWTFTHANLTSSASFNPTVTFNSLDSTTAQLIVTTIHGCKDTVSVPLSVLPSPSASFTVSDVCAGLPVTIHNTSTVAPVGSSVNYNWMLFGASTSSSSDYEPSVSYSVPGTYSIMLIAGVSGGCIDTLLGEVKIHPYPVASFDAPSACSGNRINMINLSSIDLEETISQYHWNFAGGSPSSSNTAAPSILYDSAGTFPVSLIAVSPSGCADTTVGSIVIHALPRAMMNEPDSGCVPVCHTFSDQSASVDGAITNWQWNFPGGDPGTSSDQQAGEVCYNRPGIYNASLTVMTEYGCQSRQAVPGVVRVFALPQADYTTNVEQTSILTPVITFIDQSSADVINRWWNFGDGTSLLDANRTVTHSYASTVSENDFHHFTTSLIVINNHGCMDTVYKPLDMNPDFAFYVPSAFTPNGDSRNSTFYAKGFGVKQFDIWVLDRWGLEIWSCHQEGPNVPWDVFGSEGMPSSCQWDGMVSGRPVQQDVYVWKVRLTDVFGKEHSYLGTVTVYF